MTTLNPTTKRWAEFAAERTGLPARFFASWWVSENGWETWPSTNNVGNISFLGSGVPHTGLFEGVTEVLPNKVVVYSTPEHGVMAFIELLSTPVADKPLTVDLAQLKACGGDIQEMCRKVGQSNWAGSHYEGEGFQGGLIWGVYNSAEMAAVFGEHKAIAPEKPVAERSVKNPYHVQAHDTWEVIAKRFSVTVAALRAFNGEAEVKEGEVLTIPARYRVRPGDTVSAIALHEGVTVAEVAKANSINPDFIQVGQTLFV